MDTSSGKCYAHRLNHSSHVRHPGTNRRPYMRFPPRPPPQQTSSCLWSGNMPFLRLTSLGCNYTRCLNRCTQICPFRHYASLSSTMALIYTPDSNCLPYIPQRCDTTYDLLTYHSMFQNTCRPNTNQRLQRYSTYLRQHRIYQLLSYNQRFQP